MKSSRSLGWLVWEVAGGAGAPSEETPSALCLTCSFWSRRSFLTSLAFRHRGRLASAPRPAWQRTRRGERNCLDAPLRRADEGEKNNISITTSPPRLQLQLNEQLLSSRCSENVCFQLFGFVFFSHQQIWWREQREPQSEGGL